MESQTLIRRAVVCMVFQGPIQLGKFLTLVPALLIICLIRRMQFVEEKYTVIRSLIRVLEGGVEGKRQVDKVIDKCASMQNLREAIATYRNSILRQPDEMKREASLSFFVEYLERYYFLICFAVYLHTEREALHPKSPDQRSFADWMKARPELYSIIRRSIANGFAKGILFKVVDVFKEYLLLEENTQFKGALEDSEVQGMEVFFYLLSDVQRFFEDTSMPWLLRRNPMGALGYANSNPVLKRIAESSDGRPCEMSVVAALRNGEVLGSQTVLKSDHCPGCQHPSLPERVEGAPNFREIPGFPVYGVANPTIDGIRSVIQRTGSSKGGRPVFWHNMREEPVVYINGKPFVLREVERPYKNMLEYSVCTYSLELYFICAKLRCGRVCMAHSLLHLTAYATIPTHSDLMTQLAVLLEDLVKCV
ncbi:hypothetical protein Acr_00g0012640 [Actinidia rufa]|uniref:Uncharacterized protein n=1 Tax=Actinidia rufa TaxID=165716 RepID=A0A7J0D9S7_9ERIC|nr:hypothetical protein Acr_00g0012640 [Actinidia rufa]